MQSAVIWNEIDQLRYAVVKGDWSRFQGVYINDSLANRELVDELTALVYSPEGQTLIKFCHIDIFAAAIREGACVVECGCIV
jgi:hypothetical protein